MPDTNMPQTRSLDEIRSAATRSGPPARRQVAQVQPQQVAPERDMPSIRVGFGDLASFEFTQRAAKALASSTLVPPQYRMRVQNKKTSEWEDNISAIPNCVIALNMADRIGADPLMVMQNLYIVEGRPAWSAQFVIAAINSSRRYTSLQYEVRTEGEIECEYEEVVWENAPNGRRNRNVIKHKVKVPKTTWIAWATEKETGARIESPPVSMEMAVAEGWYGKAGSKWKTMPGIMGRYRAASFFGRTYCPELLMGIRTVEEVGEIIDAERGFDDTWEVPSTGRMVEANEEQDTGEQDAGEAPAEAQTETKQVEHQPTLNQTFETKAATAQPVETKAAPAAAKAPPKAAAKPAPAKQAPAAQDEPPPGMFDDDGTEEVTDPETGEITRVPSSELEGTAPARTAPRQAPPARQAAPQDDLGFGDAE